MIHDLKNKYLFGLIFAMIILSFGIPGVKGALVLDNVQFDPPIVSSGDTVDIIVQFHDVVKFEDESRINDEDYKFVVELTSDDILTEQFISFQDSEGDDLFGSVFSGQSYNKKFRIKVNQNAPAGDYEFKLTGQWYYKGVAEKESQYVRFRMNVKREGINLGIANVVSSPDRIRSGDKDIMISAELFNVGEKTAKNVNIILHYPEGISAAYTNNNQLNIGIVESMDRKQVNFYLDTSNNLKEGVYEIAYTLIYQDVDSNEYKKTDVFPIVIKKRPYIKVVSVENEGLAGETANVKVILENIGEETADSVDVRIIKQSSQPFEMDVRSAYVGQMKSGEQATAIFKIDINRDAEIKEHRLNVAIRAKGDLEEGDSNIYSYSDSISLDVVGSKANNYPIYAGIFAVLVIISTMIYYSKKKK
ncbi:MAG: COG1361 S-layer family protein [Candidatus Nanoarchaeia archaeon]